MYNQYNNPYVRPSQPQQYQYPAYPAQGLSVPNYPAQPGVGAQPQAAYGANSYATAYPTPRPMEFPGTAYPTTGLGMPNYQVQQGAGAQPQAYGNCYATAYPAYQTPQFPAPAPAYPTMPAYQGQPVAYVYPVAPYTATNYQVQPPVYKQYTAVPNNYPIMTVPTEEHFPADEATSTSSGSNGLPIANEDDAKISALKGDRSSLLSDLRAYQDRIKEIEAEIQEMITTTSGVTQLHNDEVTAIRMSELQYKLDEAKRDAKQCVALLAYNEAQLKALGQ